MKAKKEKEIYLGSGSGYLNIKTAEIVETTNTLRLKIGDNDFVNLDVKITADFSTIPEKYHEVFLNIMSAKYMDSVSFGDNPFSKCLPPPKKKWWQFWKANLSI